MNGNDESKKWHLKLHGASGSLPQVPRSPTCKAVMSQKGALRLRLKAQRKEPIVLAQCFSAERDFRATLPGAPTRFLWPLDPYS